MLDFSSGAGLAGNTDLIPNNQLAWAIVDVRGVKQSQSGGQYLDIELTLDDGQPFARRKVWEMVGDPNHAGNSEAYRQMGLIAITRMLEAGRGAGPHNPAGYQIPNYEALSQLRVAIKIKVEKGKDGNPDKNRVAEWLTPNPASQSGHKGYQDLVAGKHNTSAPAGPPPNGFGGGFGQAPAFGGQAPAFGGGFGGGAAQQPPAPQSFGQPQGAPGFQQPQQPAAAGWGQPSNAGNAEQQSARTTLGMTAATPAVPTTSPSNPGPGQTPGWLAQAGTPPQQ